MLSAVLSVGSKLAFENSFASLQDAWGAYYCHFVLPCILSEKTITQQAEKIKEVAKKLLAEDEVSAEVELLRKFHLL